MEENESIVGKVSSILVIESIDLRLFGFYIGKLFYERKFIQTVNFPYSHAIPFQTFFTEIEEEFLNN